MALAAMLIDALHAAFEYGIEIFDRVCMNLIANVFIGFVTNAFMAREVVAEREIIATFVVHHRGFFRNIGLDDRDYINRAGAFDMKRANLPTIAIDKR